MKKKTPVKTVRLTRWERARIAELLSADEIPWTHLQWAYYMLARRMKVNGIPNKYAVYLKGGA
jgi:hypothetical protein